MADPVSIMMAVGTAVNVMGSLSQGQAQSNAYEYNAAVAQQNAGVARDQAAFQASQQERENKLRAGAIAAAQGKSGGTSSGSVLDVLGDVAAQGELERQSILYQGEINARGQMNTAALDRMSASNARTGSYWKAGGELLAGGVRTAHYGRVPSRGGGSADYWGSGPGTL